MAAPRATQFIALRRLAVPGQHVRHLHMTGPATYASPILTTERPVTNLPRDIAGLRVECKRRKLEFNGSKQELMGRLNADELTHSRAFSTAIEQAKRPVPSVKIETSPARHFNTSRSLKAVNDSSTIDFAFLPTIDQVATETVQMRVPLLPTNFFPSRNGAHAPESDEAPVMRAEVSAASHGIVFSPMSDVHDNNAMPIDFHAIADKVAVATKQIQIPVEEQAGVLKQLWNDIIDDILGPKRAGKADRALVEPLRVSARSL